MQFLNKEIEVLTKRKKTSSLIKREVSCGIFQDIENVPSSHTDNENLTK